MSAFEELLAPKDEPPLPEEIEAVWQALSMLSCPWYRGVGICSNGCRDEPACQTDEPADGWVLELRRAAAAVPAGPDTEEGP